MTLYNRNKKAVRLKRTAFLIPSKRKYVYTISKS